MPSKQSIIDTRIGVLRCDNVQEMGREGWMNEWANPNGKLDYTFSDYISDLDGADWAGVTYGEDEVYRFDETLKLRQPTQEVSGWDNEAGSAFPSAIIRFPQVRARYAEFDINSTDLDFGNGPLYLSAQLVIGDQTYWINRTIDASTVTIKIDLEQILGETSDDIKYNPSHHNPQYESDLRMQWRPVRKTPSCIFDSSCDNAVQTPLLVTVIYQEDPATLPRGDVLAAMENLVFFNYEYLRMAIDTGYALEYQLMWAQEEANHAVMKPIMITVGIAMVIGGAIQCSTGTLSVTGVPTMLFGLDMVTSNTVGYSVLDTSLSFWLAIGFRLTGRNSSLVFDEGFSFFQFTDNYLTNLILTQITFMLVGGGLTGFSGFRDFLSGMVGKMETAADTLTSESGAGGVTLSKLLELAREASGRSDVYLLARYLAHQAEHLVTGSLFLFALGSIGSAFGESSLIAEVLLQGMMLTQVVVGTVTHVLQTRMKGELGTMAENYRELTQGLFSRGLTTIKEIKEIWSGVIQSKTGSSYLASYVKLLIGLQIASQALQVTTVLIQLSGV